MDFPKSVPNIGLVGGVFVDENQLTGTPGSLIPSVWGNSITQEVLNVITAAGLAPSESDVSQLVGAIRKLSGGYALFSNLSVSTVLGAAAIGKAFLLGGTGTVITLPAAAVAFNGAAVTFMPQQPCVLQAAAGESIIDQDGTPSGTLQLYPGDQLTLCANGTGFWFRASYARAVAGSPIGYMANAKLTVAAASATANFTADEILVKTALGNISWMLSGYSKAVNLGITGPAGMDTGAAPVNGYVALYAIYNPTTRVSSILAVNATAAVMPAVYGGANMPSGFIASALISVLPTNGSGQFKVCSQVGRKISLPKTTAYTSASANPTVTPFSLSTVIPQNATEIFGMLATSSTSASNIGLTIYSNSALVGEQNVSGTIAAGGGCTDNFSNLPILTVQTASVATINTAGTPTYTIYITGYLI